MWKSFRANIKWFIMGKTITTTSLKRCCVLFSIRDVKGSWESEAETQKEIRHRSMVLSQWPLWKCDEMYVHYLGKTTYKKKLAYNFWSFVDLSIDSKVQSPAASQNLDRYLDLNFWFSSILTTLSWNLWTYQHKTSVKILALLNSLSLSGYNNYFTGLMYDLRKIWMLRPLLQCLA